MLAGHERTRHDDPLRILDSEEAAFEAVQERRSAAGDVIVIRYEVTIIGRGPATGWPS